MIPHFIRFILELLWWDWQHVGSFETKFEYHHDTWEIYIHCYESRWGARKIKIRGAHFEWNRTNLPGFGVSKRVKARKLYQTEILPWLHGRLHNKIPSYQKVKSGKWDFLKKLKGETPIVLNDDEK